MRCLHGWGSRSCPSLSVRFELAQVRSLVCRVPPLWHPIDAGLAQVPPWRGGTSFPPESDGQSEQGRSSRRVRRPSVVSQTRRRSFLWATHRRSPRLLAPFLKEVRITMCRRNQGVKCILSDRDFLVLQRLRDSE